jgi:hypothetical protein
MEPSEDSNFQGINETWMQPVLPNSVQVWFVFSVYEMIAKNSPSKVESD